MIKSMTGYGLKEFQFEESICTIEIKTLNNRYFDFIPKLPRVLQSLEIEIKKNIHRYISRGRVEVSIYMTNDALMKKSLQVDTSLLDSYVQTAKDIENKYEVKNDLTIHSFIYHNDIFTVEQQPMQLDNFENLFFEKLNEAIIQVEDSRKEEGIFLQKDMVHRVKEMKNQINKLDSFAPVVLEEYRNRIKNRITDYVGNELALTDTHILQEIALLAEKGDITEELTRLLSHLQQYERLLQSEGPVGRKLDFINQEIHREINTIGSKSIDPVMSEIAIELKSINEKLKEQIQNIE